jgi:hypothetical protein
MLHPIRSTIRTSSQSSAEKAAKRRYRPTGVRNGRSERAGPTLPRNGQADRFGSAMGFEAPPQTQPGPRAVPEPPGCAVFVQSNQKLSALRIVGQNEE